MSNTRGNTGGPALPGSDSSSLLTPGASTRSYGSSVHWTAIPECRKISEHSCDLTYYTLDSEQRYYARVRAVSGNHTSHWQRTSAFSPQEGGLGFASVHPALGLMGSGCQTAWEELWDERTQGYLPPYLPGGQVGGTGGWDSPRMGGTVTAQPGAAKAERCEQETALTCCCD